MWTNVSLDRAEVQTLHFPVSLAKPQIRQGRKRQRDGIKLTKKAEITAGAGYFKMSK